jgi:hypothetical protein
VDQKEYRSMISSLLSLTATRPDIQFLCVCALIFRRHRGLHIDRLSSGSSGIFDTLLSLVFGTRRPPLFLFLVFRMLILWGVESIGSRLRGLVSFWVPRLFLVLLAEDFTSAGHQADLQVSSEHS